MLIIFRRKLNQHRVVPTLSDSVFKETNLKESTGTRVA